MEAGLDLKPGHRGCCLGASSGARAGDRTSQATGTGLLQGCPQGAREPGAGALLPEPPSLVCCPRGAPRRCSPAGEGWDGWAGVHGHSEPVRAGVGGREELVGKRERHGRGRGSRGRARPAPHQPSGARGALGDSPAWKATLGCRGPRSRPGLHQLFGCLILGSPSPSAQRAELCPLEWGH